MWRVALTEELFFLLQRKIVENLPEEPYGGMVLPVVPFVFGSLKMRNCIYLYYIS